MDIGCETFGVISTGVFTESFNNWSDGVEVVGVDWEKAWVIDWSKAGLSTELRFFSDILSKSHAQILF